MCLQMLEELAFVELIFLQRKLLLAETELLGFKGNAATNETKSMQK